MPLVYRLLRSVDLSQGGGHDYPHHDREPENVKRRFGLPSLQATTCASSDWNRQDFALSQSRY